MLDPIRRRTMTLNAEYTPLLISASAFFSILLFIICIYYYARQRVNNRALIEKIKRGGETAKPTEPADVPGNFRNQIFGFLGSLGQRMGPEKTDEPPNMRLSFLQAGFRRKNAPAVFWGLKCVLMILLPACFLFIRITIFKLMSPSMTLTVGTIMALIGFYSPDIWLRAKIAGRREKIFQALPDALDLLVVCAEAGMGLDAAINRVAKEIRWSSKELSDELKLLNLELRAGKLRRDALRNLALRVDLEDLRNLVTLLIQTDKFGTSVANALRVYSDSLRTKRYQRAEEMAVKLPTKLIFPLILFIFPSLFVALLGPAAINIYRVFLSR